jgi:hypothetical protein
MPVREGVSKWLGLCFPQIPIILFYLSIQINVFFSEVHNFFVRNPEVTRVYLNKVATLYLMSFIYQLLIYYFFFISKKSISLKKRKTPLNTLEYSKETSN